MFPFNSVMLSIWVLSPFLCLLFTHLMMGVCVCRSLAHSVTWIWLQFLVWIHFNGISQWINKCRWYTITVSMRWIRFDYQPKTLTPNLFVCTMYIHIYKRMISERVFGCVCVNKMGKLYFKTKHQTLQFNSIKIDRKSRERDWLICSL